MSEYNVRLGRNIREARTRRHISAESLAEKVTQGSGKALAGDTILKYEKGERSIAAEMVQEIAIALDCDMQTLLQGTDRRTQSGSEHLEYGKLEADEAQILRNMATTWKGDKHGLLMIVGAYMALPRKYRESIAIDVFAMVEVAIRNGAIAEEDLPKGYRETEKLWAK